MTTTLKQSNIIANGGSSSYILNTNQPLHVNSSVSGGPGDGSIIYGSANNTWHNSFYRLY